jgi:hypothetical protein
MSTRRIVASILGFVFAVGGSWGTMSYLRMPNLKNAKILRAIPLEQCTNGSRIWIVGYNADADPRTLEYTALFGDDNNRAPYAVLKRKGTIILLDRNRNGWVDSWVRVKTIKLTACEFVGLESKPVQNL